MATASQQSFAATYGPYAQQAGAKLGVDPNIVLGQWGIETGWQTPASGNLAGISPGGKLATYSSPQAFTDAYTSTIQHNFPGAVNAGSDANAFNQGLVNGPHGSYYQGYDAASQGLHVPTAKDQSAYLGSLTTAQNANLVQYSGPANGTIAHGPDPGGYYPDGTPMYDPNLGMTAPDPSAPIIDPTTGEPIGGGTSLGTGVSGASGYTGTQAGQMATNAAAGAAAGSGVGFPLTVGLQAGVGAAIGQLTTSIENTASGLVTGAEKAVGNAFKAAFGGLLASIENWVGRGFLIVLGLLLLGLALWRIMDPSGEKTRTVVRTAAEAA